MLWFRTSLVLLAMATASCVSIGPETIARDRLDYQEALSGSWKRQTLLNLVRIRYSEPPVMLEVASIVNSYSYEAGGSLGASFGPQVDDIGNGGLQGSYSDRPTISYSPVTGDQFAKNFIAPMPPTTILSLIQVGYPADAVLRLCVKSINGVFNQSGAYMLRRPASPEFGPLAQALRRIQSSGLVGLRLEPHATGEKAVVFFPSESQPTLASEQALVAKTLGLEPASEYQLAFGGMRRGPNEIAILSRSMLEIMAEIASWVDVPQGEVAEGRVVPPPDFGDSGVPALPPVIRVRCGDEAPPDAYVAVSHRGHWFWIDDRDIPSKQVFSFLMILFSLAETGGRSALPILTIPTS